MMATIFAGAERAREMLLRYSTSSGERVCVNMVICLRASTWTCVCAEWDGERKPFFSFANAKTKLMTITKIKNDSLEMQENIANCSGCPTPHSRSISNHERGVERGKRLDKKTR